MPEITDKNLAEIRADLTSCSPLVQSLVERLDRVEGEKSKLCRRVDDLEELLVSDAITLAGAVRNEFVEKENTALRERVKRMEQRNAKLETDLAGELALSTRLNMEWAAINKAIYESDIEDLKEENTALRERVKRDRLYFEKISMLATPPSHMAAALDEIYDTAQAALKEGE